MDTAKKTDSMQELVTSQPQQAQDIQATTPSALLALAVQQGADLSKLEKLMELQERWEKNEARKAWVVAMSAFKANPPEIFKDKKVSFKTDKGTTSYNHSTIGHVVEAITGGLGQHGLSHRWDTQQGTGPSEGGRITVTCYITHVMGHTESTALSASPDASGSKNNIQAIGSTITYLQRYTLLAATGLASKEFIDDDDGVGAEPVERISENQLADLKAKIEEVGVDTTQFLKFLKLQKLDDMPVTSYAAAIQALVDKAKGARK